MPNTLQGIFGKFQPVIDNSVATSDEQMQGVFGKFQPVIDTTAAAPSGYANKVNGILPANIAKVNGVLKANISTIMGA